METATPPAAVPGRFWWPTTTQPFAWPWGKVLERSGFQCETAGSAAEAVDLLRTKEYDVLLADINMPGNARLELIADLPAVLHGLPIILITGEPTVETASRSVRLRVRADLTKPPDFAELRQLLNAAVTERRDLRLLNDNRQRIQNWDRELERIRASCNNQPMPTGGPPCRELRAADVAPAHRGPD